LLRNARQAGAANASVDFKVDSSARSAVITVTDDGPGLTPEQVAQLFQPFAPTNKPAGTGLGLYLCRRYIELMQGDLRVEGRPGKGARFTIRLPGKVANVEPDSAEVGASDFKLIVHGRK
jgi:signal transduction histidine kinase